MAISPSISALYSSSHLAIKLRYEDDRVSAASTAFPARSSRYTKIAFLIDTSGSMEGQRLTSVKRTLHAARDLFEPSDRVTLITFDDTATSVVRAHPMTEEGLATFYEHVDAIRTRGCTNLSAAIEMLIDIQPDGGYDAVVILTDGQLNRGITTHSGILTLMQGLHGNVPVTGLGYGADHNRTLLRNVALQTRGTYTYVDTDETLPVVMGDLLSGLRDVRSTDGTITVSDGWTCMELCASDPYRVGPMVGERDYWVVYKKTGNQSDAPTVQYRDANTYAECSTFPGEITDQVIRARVAKALYDTTNYLETHTGPSPIDDLNALKTELDAIVPKTSISLRMAAQIGEAIDALNTVPSPWGMTAQATRIDGLSMGTAATGMPVPLGMNIGVPTILSMGTGAAMGGGLMTPMTDILARMASNTAYYSTQRGVGDDGSQMFSSPCQRVASTQCRSAYDDMDDDPTFLSQSQRSRSRN